MTTIASDGVTVAADGLRCGGDEPTGQNAIKIERIGGIVVGFSGTWFYRDPAIKWWLNGCPEDKMPKISGTYYWDLILFRPAGVTVYSHDSPYPDNNFEYPFAAGAGAHYAQGALLAGVGPGKAVEIAAKCNVHTGGKIIELSIRGNEDIGGVFQQAAE